MAGLPSVHYIQNFTNDIRHKVQQMSSVLRNCVIQDFDFTGEYKYYEQMGKAGAFRKRQQRFENTVYGDMDHVRRRISKNMFTNAALRDSYDEVNQILDHTSAYAQSLVMGAVRQIDDTIIEDMLGTAATGKAGATGVALPGTQVVAVGTSGLTIAKILEAMEILNSNDVDPSEEKYLVIGPKQVTNLMNEVKYTSKDYVDFGALQSGKLVPFHGFNLLMSNRLGLSTTTRQCIAFCRTGFVLGIARDITVRVSELAEKNYAKQVYVELAMGGTRLEEEKVVRVDCSEA